MAVDPASITMAQTIGVLVEGQRHHSERMDRMDSRMDRLEAKIDRLMWMLMGVLGATLATLATTLIESA